MKYIVTGGAGFIGSNFINYMFEKYKSNITIINIDNLTYAANLDYLSNVKEKYGADNYFFEKVNICNRSDVNRIFKIHKPDYVINFAAETHVDRSIKNPQLFIESNIMGTQVLLEASLENKVRRFHQVSTDEVYGSLGNTGYFMENTPLAPNSPYSASKASADLLCSAYLKTYSAPISISRCSNNYGKHQHTEKLIPVIISKLLKQEKVPIYGNGKNVRDWLHVHDHCSAILR